MKDFVGNELSIGDIVAVIYHPEAYKFSVEAARIKEVKGKKNMIVTELLNSSDVTPGYYPDKSGDTYRRIVKINPEFPQIAEGETTDAVGHSIHVGARIACQRLSEAGGNTVKGFDKGGIVTKLTEHYAFYIDELTGETKRKALNRAVVY